MSILQQNKKVDIKAADYFLQFNGTAGIWRKIMYRRYGGGWEADTLTEDLDLSYRAQLKNWKIKFLEDVTAPANYPQKLMVSNLNSPDG